MTLAALIHSVGNIGIFPSRAFIPAFATALMLRFGHDIPIIQNSSMVRELSHNPTWFTSDAALVILGVLSLLEIIATKSSDVREFLHEFDLYIKSIMAFLTTQGVLSASDRQLVGAIDGGTVANLGVAAGVGGAVFVVSALRQSVMTFLSATDPHDDLHIQRLISWFEDLWSGFGLLLLVLFPFLILFIVLLITCFLYGLRRYLEYREQKSKIPCACCSHMLFPVALACPVCMEPVARPHKIGFMGRVSSELVTDRRAHELDMIARKRCPVCATRFTQRAAQQTCAECAQPLMNDPSTRDAYLKHIDGRVVKTLGVCMALGVIPVLGLIPGIIYYRFRLVGPFRQYVPFGMGILVKWGVRLLNLILILLQPIPFMGAFLLPVMAYTNYRVYRSVYVSGLNSSPPLPAPARRPVPAPAAPAPNTAPQLETQGGYSDFF